MVPYHINSAQCVLVRLICVAKNELDIVCLILLLLLTLIGVY